MDRTIMARRVTFGVVGVLLCLGGGALLNSGPEAASAGGPDVVPRPGREPVALAPVGGLLDFCGDISNPCVLEDPGGGLAVLAATLVRSLAAGTERLQQAEQEVAALPGDTFDLFEFQDVGDCLLLSDGAENIEDVVPTQVQVCRVGGTLHNAAADFCTAAGAADALFSVLMTPALQELSDRLANAATGLGTLGDRIVCLQDGMADLNSFICGAIGGFVMGCVACGPAPDADGVGPPDFEDLLDLFVDLDDVVDDFEAAIDEFLALSEQIQGLGSDPLLHYATIVAGQFTCGEGPSYVAHVLFLPETLTLAEIDPDSPMLSNGSPVHQLHQKLCEPSGTPYWQMSFIDGGESSFHDDCLHPFFVCASTMDGTPVLGMYHQRTPHPAAAFRQARKNICAAAE